MNFISRYLLDRSYEKAKLKMIEEFIHYSVLSERVVDDCLTATKQDAFEKYSNILNVAEAHHNICKKMLDNIKKYEDKTSERARADALVLAKSYERLAKKLAFISYPLTHIGEFQPQRCLELLQDISMNSGNP